MFLLRHDVLQGICMHKNTMRGSQGSSQRERELEKES